jgi:hypothetical protein
MSFVATARSRLRASQRPATASEWSSYSACCTGLVRLLKAHDSCSGLGATHQLLADLLLRPAALKQASVGCDGLFCPSQEAGQPELAKDVVWLSLQLQDAARKLEAGQLAVTAQAQAAHQQEALPLQVLQQLAQQQDQAAACGKRSNASASGAGPSSSGKVCTAVIGPTLPRPALLGPAGLSARCCSYLYLRECTLHPACSLAQCACAQVPAAMPVSTTRSTCLT